MARAWRASPTHRANIVKPVYREIGVGIANGLYKGQPATFVVQYFGKSEGNTLAQGQVLGAEVFSSQSGLSSLENSLGRAVARLAAEPRSTSEWLFGGVAALVVPALGLAFFIHIEVQPTEMLLGAGFVAVFAVSLIAINAQLLSAPEGGVGQSASVAETLRVGVVIGDSGAAVQR